MTQELVLCDAYMIASHPGNLKMCSRNYHEMLITANPHCGDAPLVNTSPKMISKPKKKNEHDFKGSSVSLSVSSNGWKDEPTRETNLNPSPFLDWSSKPYTTQRSRFSLRHFSSLSDTSKRLGMAGKQGGQLFNGHYHLLPMHPRTLRCSLSVGGGGEGEAPNLIGDTRSAQRRRRRLSAALPFTRISSVRG